MKLELLSLEKKKGIIHILVKESSASFVNLIRRTIIDDIPTLAVEDIEFKDNSSALYDEMVAHRLGLIPIITDAESYNFKAQCNCKGEGCAKCQLKITLKAAKKGIVIANEAKSSDPKCVFAYDNMPIAKLSSHQKIELEAIAVLGTGREHAKWSPALVYYKKEPSIKVEGIKLNEEKKAAISRACGAFVAVDGNKIKIDKEKLFTSLRFDGCVGALLDAGAEVSDGANFIFTVESWGQYDCKELLEQAAEIIVQRLDALEQQLS